MPVRYIVTPGEKLGYFTVVKTVKPPAHLSTVQKTYVLAKCECGNERVLLYRNIFSGGTKSCGCMKRKLLATSFTTHGLKKHPLYSVYHNMLERCCNRKCPAYKDYGGRGIKVCASWRKDIRNFVEWAENLPTENAWRKGLQLDRIDNDGDYSPNNCEFTTRIVNGNHKRNNNYYPYRGQKLTVAEISRESGIEYHKLRRMLLNGVNL